MRKARYRENKKAKRRKLQAKGKGDKQVGLGASRIVGIPVVKSVEMPSQGITLPISTRGDPPLWTYPGAPQGNSVWLLISSNFPAVQQQQQFEVLLAGGISARLPGSDITSRAEIQRKFKHLAHTAKETRGVRRIDGTFACFGLPDARRAPWQKQSRLFPSSWSVKEFAQATTDVQSQDADWKYPLEDSEDVEEATLVKGLDSLANAWVDFALAAWQNEQDGAVLTLLKNMALQDIRSMNTIGRSHSDLAGELLKMALFYTRQLSRAAITDEEAKSQLCRLTKIAVFFGSGNLASEHAVAAFHDISVAPMLVPNALRYRKGDCRDLCTALKSFALVYLRGRVLRRRSTSPISYEVRPAGDLVRYVDNIRWLYLLAAGMVANIRQCPAVTTGVAVVKEHLDFISLAREHRLLLTATRAASGALIEDLVLTADGQVLYKNNILLNPRSFGLCVATQFHTTAVGLHKFFEKVGGLSDVLSALGMVGTHGSLGSLGKSGVVIVGKGGDPDVKGFSVIQLPTAAAACASFDALDMAEVANPMRLS